jgi:hypothetical protein
MENGIELLRSKRGPESVTFNDVSDHLFDYLKRHPDHEAVVQALAGFLARVEDVDHEHSGEEAPPVGSSL